MVVEVPGLDGKASLSFAAQVGGPWKSGCRPGRGATPLRINMEPQNHWVVEENCLPPINSQVPCSFLGGTAVLGGQKICLASPDSRNAHLKNPSFRSASEHLR